MPLGGMPLAVQASRGGSPMAETVGEFIVRRLREWGVHRVYGYPGDGIKDVSKEYCQTVCSPMAARHVIDRAMRIALDQSTVTCVILPKDVQEEKAVPDVPQKHDTAQTGIGHAVPHIIPRDPDLRRAADLLNRAE